MDQEAFRDAMREIGRRGGQARAKSLTAKERRASATKASKAAALARTRKAAKYKKEMEALTGDLKERTTKLLKTAQASAARLAKKKKDSAK